MMATRSKFSTAPKIETRTKAKAKRPPVRQTSSGRYSGPGSAKMREEFEGTLAAERREAEAKAAKAEARRDAQPSSSGPRGGRRMTPGRTIGSKAGSGANRLNRTLRGFLRLGTANPRQVLTMELVAVLVIVTVDQLSHGDVPTPRAYVAPFIVYLILAFAAEVGGNSGARIATGLGLLVLVALVIANAPGIVKALGVVSGGRSAPVEEGVG
jgi:hypothetical protein